MYRKKLPWIDQGSFVLKLLIVYLVFIRIDSGWNSIRIRRRSQPRLNILLAYIQEHMCKANHHIPNNKYSLHIHNFHMHEATCRSRHNPNILHTHRTNHDHNQNQYTNRYTNNIHNSLYSNIHSMTDRLNNNRKDRHRLYNHSRSQDNRLYTDDMSNNHLNQSNHCFGYSCVIHDYLFLFRYFHNNYICNVPYHIRCNYLQNLYNHIFNRDHHSLFYQISKRIPPLQTRPSWGSSLVEITI